MANKSATTDAKPTNQLDAVLNDLSQQTTSIPTTVFSPMAKTGLAVFRAIAAITAELGKEGIKKEGTAKEGGGFKYRGVDQVYAALNPLLAQHNLMIIPRIVRREETERRTRSGSALFDVVVYAEFDFISAEDGSRVTAATIGEAFDSGDKATNKAMAVAFKYAAFLAFCIPVDGENTDDPDAYQDHDLEPKSGAKQSAKAPTNAGPELTQAEAEKNYLAAVDLLQACATEGELEKCWNVEIKWDRIPNTWHDSLKKVRREHSVSIARPKPSEKLDTGKQAIAPTFDSKDGIDDDIPF